MDELVQRQDEAPATLVAGQVVETPHLPGPPPFAVQRLHEGGDRRFEASQAHVLGRGVQQALFGGTGHLPLTKGRHQAGQRHGTAGLAIHEPLRVVHSGRLASDVQRIHVPAVADAERLSAYGLGHAHPFAFRVAHDDDVASVTDFPDGEGLEEHGFSGAHHADDHAVHRCGHAGADRTPRVEAERCSCRVLLADQRTFEFRHSGGKPRGQHTRTVGACRMGGQVQHAGAAEAEQSADATEGAGGPRKDITAGFLLLAGFLPCTVHGLFAGLFQRLLACLADGPGDAPRFGFGDGLAGRQDGEP